VPPFGHPILPFDVFADPSITGNDRIAFNAGSLTDSIVMGVADYLEVARPSLFGFAAPG
jgi:prolyl-tRNA editing enzyme YbaK/EbsC (Cys-tRNA(Pro) deacylase)